MLQLATKIALDLFSPSLSFDKANAKKKRSQHKSNSLRGLIASTNNYSDSWILRQPTSVYLLLNQLLLFIVKVCGIKRLFNKQKNSISSRAFGVFLVFHPGPPDIVRPIAIFPIHNKTPSKSRINIARTYNKLVFLMGDIKSGRKMNFSFLLRVQCVFFSLASLNHENRYFIHESVSDFGAAECVLYFFLKPNIPKCNFITYKLIRQRNEKKCELFVVGVSLLSPSLSLASLSFSQSRDKSSNVLRLGRVFFCWTRENKFLALSLQVNSGPKTSGDECVIFLLSLSHSLSMLNLMALVLVCMLIQWYFRDFSARVFVYRFFWRTFFQLVFLWLSRLIISLECVKSSSCSLWWFDFFQISSRCAINFLRIREMENKLNLMRKKR